MTVIAWDGKTLAADKRTSHGTLIRTTKKIHRLHDGSLVGFSGESAFSAQMLAWFLGGEQPDKLPSEQRDKDDWCAVLVIRPGGRIERYERSPYPVVCEDKQYAIGCGRDFALMAMHLGKTAREAVELTALFDSGTGNGVDVLELDVSAALGALGVET